MPPYTLFRPDRPPLAFGVWRWWARLYVGKAELYPAAAGLAQLPPPRGKDPGTSAGIEIEDEDENGMTPNSSTTNFGVGGELKDSVFCPKFDA